MTQLFVTNQNITYGEVIKAHSTTLSQTHNGAKLHMSTFDTFTVITNHVLS